MISVREAEHIIYGSLRRMPVVVKPLRHACGYVLAEDIKNDRAQPPYDRVMMDGIAVRFDLWRKGLRRFTVQGIQAAGQPAKMMKAAGGCMEVMTGALMPRGCDSVVPLEAVVLRDGIAQVHQDYVLSQGACVHRRGADAQKGTIVLRRKTRLFAAQLSLAASAGHAQLNVYGRPSVAVLSTGDELVAVHRTPASHQIRQSNVPAIVSVLKAGPAQAARTWHVRDQLSSVVKRLEALRRQCDVLIISGGVSKGKFDYVREALKTQGFREKFYGVSQRPGKPFCFGKIPQGPLVFCLPGNPWSSLVTFTRYVLPALRVMSGEQVQEPCLVRISGEVESVPKGWTLFVPVRMKSNQGMAEPVVPACSGDESVLGQTDGFVQLDFPRNSRTQTRPVPFYSWSAT